MAKLSFTYAQAADYVAAHIKTMKKEEGYDNQVKWFLLGMLFCWILMRNAGLLKALLRKPCRAVRLNDLIEEGTRLGTGAPSAAAHAECSYDTHLHESTMNNTTASFLVTEV
ncbi:hypothetical protein Aduo_003058 [Ancylostoma duodenale]